MIYLRTITWMRPVSAKARPSRCRRCLGCVGQILLAVTVMLGGAAIGHLIILALGGYGQ